MNFLKRLIAIVLVINMALFMLPTTTAFAADDMRYGRSKLSADLQKIYDVIAVGCEKAEANIVIDITNLNIDVSTDLGKAYDMLFYDYPEYFWLDGGWDVNYVVGGTTLNFHPSYTMTGSALASAKAAYTARVSELTKNLSGSDYEKSKTLHDRLIDAVKYISGNNDQNAYGALVEGKAVCNGYARAYQHLMLKAGIPAWYVRGESDNPATKKREAHAWNIVKLDGEWYYTDVTWDDQGEDVFYEYLNITTEKLLKGHAIDSNYASLMPQAVSTNANYYVKEDRNFSGYDQNKLVSFLKKDNNKTQIYINGDVTSFLKSVDSNILSIAADLGATGTYDISYHAAILKNAVILDFYLALEGHTHQAQKTVDLVDATCVANGTKAYYICSCGAKFLDEACTQKITSDAQIVIAATSHTPSGYQSDFSNHWKSCTKCGSEIVNTRDVHSDGNTDNICDACGYKLPNNQENKENQNNQNNQNVQNVQNNDTVSNNTESSSEVSVSDKETSSDTISEEDENAENIYTTGVASDDETSSLSDDIYYGNTDVDSSLLKWIAICGGAAVIVAGIVLTVVLLNKKNTQQSMDDEND